MECHIFSFAETFSYVSFKGFLKDLTDPEDLSVQGSKIIVAEGLQKVEVKKITMSQLCTIIRLKRIHKHFNIEIKALNMDKLFQYAAFTLISKVQIVTVTDKWTLCLSTITRDNVAEIGTYILT